jgi:hypothetical protein
MWINTSKVFLWGKDDFLDFFALSVMIQGASGIGPDGFFREWM